jgi:hypothetical protein
MVQNGFVSIGHMLAGHLREVSIVYQLLFGIRASIV